MLLKGEMSLPLSFGNRTRFWKGMHPIPFYLETLKSISFSLVFYVSVNRKQKGKEMFTQVITPAS